MAGMKIFQVLHISDLHIKDDKKGKFDRSIVLDPLIERVTKDLDEGFAPEIVVVTGDVAFQGIKPEYALVKPFFDELLVETDLFEKNLFIVPGNHDVNRVKYRPNDIPEYKNLKELNDELENKAYRKDLLKGMIDYFEFIETHYPHMESIDNRLVPFVNVHHAVCGKKIGLVGLNSAWMCRRSPDERTIALGEYQVKTAVKTLKEMDTTDLQIHMFHHPLEWLWPLDRRRCRKYFNNGILLCGHLHNAAGGYFNNHDGSGYQFQAGGAYLGSESEYPSRFQYITFDWDNSQIRLDFRKFVKDRGIWALDAETGDDGKKTFAMPKDQKKRNTYKVSTPEIPETYRAWIDNNCSYMNVDNLQAGGEAIRLDLPEVFIPLYAYEPERGVAKKDNDTHMREKTVADIETLIGHNDYLLVEGNAGSGKTTLLKHLAFSLANENHQISALAGLYDCLPILIFLYELNGLLKKRGALEEEVLTVEDILKYYFESKESVLSFEIIEQFSKEGKVLFLLDGLDEIRTDDRSAVVDAFANYKNKHKGNKIVFSGRSHGITGPAMNKFGQKHVKILTLSMDQIKTFIRRWFQFIEPRSSGKASKTADAMISEITDHKAIKELIENPLMLTATCILYNDGKRLPGQRAELYKKFVNNLLRRRFKEPEKVHNFLMTLAFNMHELGSKGMDRLKVDRILQLIYTRQNGESDDAYHLRIEGLFSDIEPKCGLLKLERSQYTFHHLSFQEFLTAVYIVKKYTIYGEAINPYWENDWYHEVIGLFIGYLSIENKEWANKIVKDALELEDAKPYSRWRLAAKSLLDMHKDTQKIDVVDLATEKLRDIIKLELEPENLVDAGETLGRLGDHRNLEEFILVKEGKFSFKKGKAKRKSFEMSKYPVTNQWYHKFIDTKGYGNPDYWSEQGKKWLTQSGVTHPEYWHDRKWNCPNSPVVGISWWEADAFCRWLTKTRRNGHTYRLPTEGEWETAAMGGKKRKYPFGDWENGICNTRESGIQKISPVGIFQKGRTPEGIFDMAGNVWEWTTTNYDLKKDVDDFAFDADIQALYNKGNYLDALNQAGKKKIRPSLRGGSWVNTRGLARCADRNRHFPNLRSDYVGFRCVRT